MLEPAGTGGFNIPSLAIKGQKLGVRLEGEVGATRTLEDDDNGAFIRVAGACTVTVPPNTEVNFPLGTQIYFEQSGVGQITFAAGAGVTIRTPETLKTAKRWAVAQLIKVAANEWTLAGYLEASA